MHVDTGSLQVMGSGRTQASRVTLSSGSGDIHIDGEIDAREDLLIGAGFDRITNDEGGSWKARSDSGALHVQGQINSEAGTIYLAGVESINMSPSAIVEARSGDIDAESLGDIGLGQLIAPQQTVAVRASGRVVNSLGAASSAQQNVVAESLVASTGTGFGEASNRIETAIADVAVTNTRGTVALDNNGALRVSSLHNNGDILLRNDRDVTVGSGGINAFYQKGVPLNPRANGEPTHGGSFDVFIVYTHRVTAYSRRH